MTTRVWLITGSSTGFGRALAAAVLQHGDRLIATARKPEQLQELITQYPDTAKAIALDVTNQQQVQLAIENAVAIWGKIDVLVNNAGYLGFSIYGASKFALEGLSEALHGELAPCC